MKEFSSSKLSCTDDLRHLLLQRIFAVRGSPVVSQEHGLVDPVRDEKECEGQDVHGEHPSGVSHRREQQRQEVRVTRLYQEPKE